VLRDFFNESLRSLFHIHLPGHLLVIHTGHIARLVLVFIRHLHSRHVLIGRGLLAPRAVNW
jgi:hypothetical protein